MSDKQRQLDEIEALESIYDKDLLVCSRWPCSGCLLISPDPLNHEIDMKILSVVNEQSIDRTIKLQYLAPIEMYFECPIDYPSKSQPLFMLKCVWLSEHSLSDICRNFDTIWDRKHTEILFDWAYFLKECCLFLNIEELNFSTIAGESHFTLSEWCLPNEKTNLHLKELKNKIFERKGESELCSDEKTRKKKCRTRERKLRGNFKYEPPKEKEMGPTNVDSGSGIGRKAKQWNQLRQHFLLRDIFIAACLIKKELQRDDSVYRNSLTVLHVPGDSTENACSARVSAFSVCLPATFEFISSMLPTYGIRRKTLFNDCDSRVIPNYEETKPDEHGICGTSLIVQKMIDFNDKCISKAFRHESHFCGICLEAKQGSESVRVQICGHIFCRECVSQYLSVNIATGNLRALQCPHVDCGTLFTVGQIRQSVDKSTFKKFEDFSRKMTVENDPNLLYCPRDVCQSVARRCLELGSELCFCSRCSFYFCIYCKKAYHGVQPCQLQNEKKLEVIQEYLNANSARQKELEKRYTKQQISKWVNEYLTSKWLEESSKPCPNCEAPIQKNDGCNKMLCLNCNIPFCWLCNKCLSTVKPYDHFTDRNSPCYQKLFIFPEAEIQRDSEDEDVPLWEEFLYHDF